MSYGLCNSYITGVSAHDVTSLYPEGVSTIATITVKRSKEKTKESLTISCKSWLTLSYSVTAH